MKLNSQIKILISVLLVFAVVSSAAIFLKSQYREKKEMITDLILQKNRFLARAVKSTPLDKIPHVLNEELNVPEWSRTLFVSSAGRVLYKDTFAERYGDDVYLKSSRLKEVLSSGSSEGVFVESGLGNSSAFLGYTSVPGVGVILSVAPVSLINKSMLFQALSVGVVTAIILTLGLLVFSAVLNRLTLGLEILAQEVGIFGRGNLKSRIKESLGAGEIDKLAQSFNSMAQNLEDLVLVKEKKSFMDAEIKTAERVQKSFFPELHVEDPHFSISGFSEQLSGCGGDWLYHFKKDNYLYIGVGDVTGHGLSSALLTGVSRAVFSVFEDDPQISPAKMLENLHKVLYKVAQGNLTMTFFLAKIDLTTGECRYSSASHCAPIVMSAKESEWDASFILGEAGPLLGTLSQTPFTDDKYTFKKGDRLFIYTDGIPEMKVGTNGKNLGDRRLLKILKESFAGRINTQWSMKFSTKLKELRLANPVDDDFSGMLIEFK